MSNQKPAMGLGAAELRTLYEQYAHLVFRRALSILGREADAWDAVQEVFERMMTASQQFRGEARPMTYLYRVTTNVCLNVVRARRLREVVGDAPTPGEHLVDEDVVEASQFLAALASQLSERELQVATLYFVDELAQEEIAEILQLSRKTIVRDVARIREQAASLARPVPSRRQDG